jgi:hypothetical protein
MRGIFSSRAINRTDHKGPSITDYINLVRRSFKSPTYLVDTLFYNINNNEDLTFIPYLTSNSPYSGISMLHMTDANNVVDKSTMMTFVGYRVPILNPSVSLIDTAQYNETLTIKNAFGTVVASSTYSDAGTGFATSTPSETYTVLNGTGRYAYAKHLTIYFNNVANTRIVQIFGYNP